MAFWTTTAAAEGSTVFFTKVECCPLVQNAMPLKR